MYIKIYCLELLFDGAENVERKWNTNKKQNNINYHLESLT